MPKRVIRQGVFETNSSSVHSLTICSQEDYDRWEKGELIWDSWDDKLIEANEETSDDERYETKEVYDDRVDSNYEGFEEKYTTKSGDQIVIFGYHILKHINKIFFLPFS